MMHPLSERLSSASATCGRSRCLRRLGRSRIGNTLGRRGSRCTAKPAQTLGQAFLCLIVSYYFISHLSFIHSFEGGPVRESLGSSHREFEVIEVLAFTKAFVVKKVGELSKKSQDALKGAPQKERLGQVSWKKQGGVAKAWKLAKMRANFV